MKNLRFTSVLILLLCIFSAGTANEISKAKKFEVIITVKYSAITLEKAAQIEKEFLEKHKDAYSIDITLKKVNENDITGSDGDGVIEFTIPGTGIIDLSPIGTIDVEWSDGTTILENSINIDKIR